MDEPRSDLMPAASLWCIWPWAACLLPLLVVLCYPRSYEQGIVYVFGVVLVPCFGILGVLPRWVLRKRGHQVVPIVVAPLLVLHWWCWVIVLLTLDSSGDISTPSLLDTLTAGKLTPGLNLLFGQCAFIVGVGTWLMSLIFSLFVRPQRGGSPRRQWTVIVVSLVAPIMLLVTAVFVTPLVVDQRKDSTGETLAVAMNRPIEEQAEIFRTRYDEAQSALAVVRAVIQPSADWKAWDMQPLDGDTSCSSYGAECYRFQVAFALNRQVTQAEMKMLHQSLEKQGWEVSVGSAGFTAVLADGERVTVSPREGDITRVEYMSQSWWGDKEQLFKLAQTSNSSEEEHQYAADEWPPL